MSETTDRAAVMVWNTGLPLKVQIKGDKPEPGQTASVELVDEDGTVIGTAVVRRHGFWNNTMPTTATIGGRRFYGTVATFGGTDAILRPFRNQENQ